MALIDKASLLMVPSTYEDGTLYNVLPSGNKAPDETGNHNGYDQTRADFTFSRGANLAATRVNAAGLIEKGRENVLLQSNSFSTSPWEKYRLNLTSGQSGYDGNNDAWLLTATDTFSARVQQAESLTGVQVLSVYAKAATANFIVSEKAGTNGFYVWFDLANGSIGNSSGDIDATIEDVGGGWYRCSVSGNPTASSKSQFYVAETNGSTTISVGASIYIQDAQLEAGLVATDYIETTTTTAKAGVLESMPRIDYSSGAGALLLEPLRTNSYLHSEYLYNFNGTETFNYATSPEGVQNATLLTKTSASDQFLSLSWSGTTISASSDYTMSIFVKHNGDDVNVRYEYNNSNDWGAVAWTALFEVRASGVTTSTVGNCTSDVEDYGSGWYRLKVFVTSGASITASSPANLFRVIGASGESVLVYGAQMEAGSYPSSYIPTMGTAASRAADSLFVESLANELTTGYTAATLMIEFKYKQNAVGDAFVWGQDDGTYPAGRGYLYAKQSGFADSFGGGGFSNMSEDTTLKLIYRLNTLSNADVFLNGTKGTNVSGTAWSAINQIRFRGAYYTFEISQVAMYSEALTDAECISLTS